MATSKPRDATRAGASSTATTPTGARCAIETSTSDIGVCPCLAAHPRAHRRGHEQARDASQEGAGTVVSLLDRTLIRVGNGEYAKENGSYGLTTLRTRHLEVAGTELHFHFKGKSGKTWRLNVRDRRIARAVRSIQELPGQRLFQFVDDDGMVRSIETDTSTTICGRSPGRKYWPRTSALGQFVGPCHNLPSRCGALPALLMELIIGKRPR